MKNQNPNKLAFNKAAVTELNDAQMHEVDGGTGSSIRTTSIVIITILKN